uniref:Uncharacterized protein n=1 Tax=Phaeomonas parva TaxID=124430 RepID=A0A7S1XLY1_9STRA|mmetsp:Transcript_20265/g.61527  ORF Transcript_20265/g.61527 Transcript_20265/m.61527 type:complete len:516 (+) Transcript_20265:302-1849(+)
MWQASGQDAWQGQRAFNELRPAPRPRMRPRTTSSGWHARSVGARSDEKRKRNFDSLLPVNKECVNRHRAKSLARLRCVLLGMVGIVGFISLSAHFTGYGHMLPWLPAVELGSFISGAAYMGGNKTKSNEYVFPRDDGGIDEAAATQMDRMEEEARRLAQREAEEVANWERRAHEQIEREMEARRRAEEEERHRLEELDRQRHLEAQERQRLEVLERLHAEEEQRRLEEERRLQEDQERLRLEHLEEMRRLEHAERRRLEELERLHNQEVERQQREEIARLNRQEHEQRQREEIERHRQLLALDEHHRRLAQQEPTQHEGLERIGFDHVPQPVGTEHAANPAEDFSAQTMLTPTETLETTDHLNKMAETSRQQLPYGHPLDVNFINMSPVQADLYFDDGRFGVFVNSFNSGESMELGTFVGHRFFWTSKDIRDQLVAGAGEGVPMEAIITGNTFEAVLPMDTRPREGCFDRYKVRRLAARSSNASNASDRDVANPVYPLSLSLLGMPRRGRTWRVP